MTRRVASIKDVAAMAGVSYQTVSRVLNHPDTVRPSTRASVERAIEVLHYHPSPTARALRSRRSGMVGVLTAPNTLFVASNGLTHLEQGLRAAGLRLLMSGIVGDDFAAMDASVRPLLEFGVDALVIIANERAAADLARQLARQLPVVAIQPGVQAEDGLSSVAIDFAAGVASVVDHLVSRGDRDLVHVPGPGHHTTMASRVDAWRSELSERGLPSRLTEPVPLTVAGGYAMARTLVERGVPEAVFTANDLVALGMLRAFHEAGVRVPDDVALVGMDDLFGSWFSIPSLSTLAQHYDVVAREAASMVLDALGGAEPRTVRLSPLLIVRESSAGVRVRSGPSAKTVPPGASV